MLAAEKAANELIAECPYGVWQTIGQTIRAEVVMYQGRLDDAERIVKSFLDRKDMPPIVHDAKLKLRLHQGRFDEAATELAELKKANKNVALLATLLQINQVLVDGAKRIDAHAEAVAAGKEKLKEPLRSMIAEAALLKGRTRLARRTYGPMMVDKPGLDEFNSHGSSVVTAYEGVSHRTNAARAAIRLAARIGNDLGTVTEDEQSAARKDAIRFLRSDFEFKTKVMTGPLKDVLRRFSPTLADQLVSRERFRRWLIFCLNCDDFKPVRDPAPLAALPAGERKQWMDLWEDMRVALQGRARWTAAKG